LAAAAAQAPVVKPERSGRVVWSTSVNEKPSCEKICQGYSIGKEEDFVMGKYAIADNYLKLLKISPWKSKGC
jgi:hypothetical protein